ANFTARVQEIEARRLRRLGLEKSMVDLVSGKTIIAAKELTLEPYQFMWLPLHRQASAGASCPRPCCKRTSRSTRRLTKGFAALRHGARLFRRHATALLPSRFLPLSAAALVERSHNGPEDWKKIHGAHQGNFRPRHMHFVGLAAQ